MAHCWEAADGIPPEVGQVLKKAADPSLADLRPVLAVPEFKVPLPGGVRPSQNDIVVLARSSAGPVSIMVEGKGTRLRFLLRALGLAAEPTGTIRYQLLHRAASAAIKGEQHRAAAAIVLIHSFSDRHVGWRDYQAFARLFGVVAEQGVVQRLGARSAVPLFGVWVVGDGSFLRS